MFEGIPMAPSDPILGLGETYAKDPRPEKINLSVGIYKDENGRTPVLETVKQVEAELLSKEKSKTYLDIAGLPELGMSVQDLLFGAQTQALPAGSIVTAQAAGGTGALRIAADLVKKLSPSSRAWVSDPTWVNHTAIFKAAGIESQAYPYYDYQNNSLAFHRMIETLSQAPKDDVVLLHACCHNPSGMDPTPAQWKELATLCRQRKIMPLFDMAYQGFGQGLDEDAASVRIFAEAGCQMLIASSYSKNFGMYNERIGALTFVGEPDLASKVFSHIKTCIRVNYSNPPAHGGAIVARILQDAQLRAVWTREVTGMRDRINGMRDLFVRTLAAKGVKRDYGFIRTQRGMFSFSGLTKEQVLRLRNEFAVYIVDSGRINVAGMTPKNMDPLCNAIAAVL